MESIEVERHVVPSDPFPRHPVGDEAIDRLAARQEDAICTAKGDAVEDPQGGSEERLADALIGSRTRQALAPEERRPIDDRAAVVHDHDRCPRSTAGQDRAGTAAERVLGHEDHLARRGPRDSGGRACDAPRVDPGAREAERVAERPGQQHRLVFHARRGVLLRHDHDSRAVKLRRCGLHHAEHSAPREARHDEDECLGDGGPLGAAVTGGHRWEG